MLEVDVMINLRKTFHKLNQVMKVKIDEYKLSFRLLHILMAIDKNPDVTQKELAKILRLSQGGLSGFIKELINKDIIKQIPKADDLRYNTLEITKYGQDIIKDYKAYGEERFKLIFKNFSQDDLNEFNLILEKMNNNLNLIDS